MGVRAISAYAWERSAEVRCNLQGGDGTGAQKPCPRRRPWRQGFLTGSAWLWVSHIARQRSARPLKTHGKEAVADAAQTEMFYFGSRDNQ